jgi:uncharacterized protein YajQ (UPF0234 family)
MPSFDLISKLDIGEVKNVVNMAQKQISGRYDFKGSNTSIELKNESIIELTAPDDYKIGAALDIFRSNMAKRSLGMKCMDVDDVKPAGNQMYKQSINIRQGIDKDQAKVINKLIKDSSFKITSQYLDEKVRVTGKKIDDLQACMQMLRQHDDVKVDLQMENMKR